MTRPSRPSWNGGAAATQRPHDTGNSTTAALHRWRHRTATAAGVAAEGAGKDSTAACQRPRGSRMVTRAEAATETTLPARPPAGNSAEGNIS